MNTSPLISVVMITYLHEKYIAEAVNGVLRQECTYPIEFLIVNDCSPDNTDAIVKKIIATHPKSAIITYIRQEKNLGVMGNFHWALEQASGKYTALCEGDDYWTDPLKLQKQVDFLEANPDYSLCFHRVYELKEGAEKVISSLNTLEKEETHTLEELAARNFIHTPSVVFRNQLRGKLPVWFKDSPVGDYILHMLNAKKGLLKYLPQCMAVYRLHRGGVWSTLERTVVIERWIIVLNFLLQEDFSGKVKDIISKQIRDDKTDYLRILLNQNSAKFLEKMAALTKDDPELSRQWLLQHYPDCINGIRNSKTYKFSQKLSNLKQQIKSVFKTK